MPESRFLTLADVAEVLNVELDTVRQLVASNELRAIQIGTGGAWRVEQTELQQFVNDQYERRRRESMFDQADFADIPEITGSFGS
ncbi:helix-turn-helix domain-containing protein [Gulosibacter bifidus]|uniref:Helix-turn-helix domain-containing protein n=1 Tax=Gulosibacter bifidus TaxID=272239 RepID=A0ABW5RJS8_9MICO|nr:helix-turn-helix domain-containing protein [Gulosibacter bifidus]